MVQAAATLLEEFRALPGRRERPRTFMEIAGYPHYENACSNILGFFMNPEELHGLRTLVLDALASACSITDTDKEVGGNVSVEREVRTDAGNRIDILIMSDEHAILIENKIYAAANNPFDDYATYLDRIANGRKKCKLLLTLYPTNEGSKWGFTNLTYEEFAGKIRSLLGYYVSGADTRHLTMFLDFLSTLENMHEGSRMDQEFIKFLSERTNDAEGLFADLVSFKDELRKKVRELDALIELEEHKNVERGFYRERMKLFDDVLYSIRVSENLLVSVDVIINPRGWRIFIWPRQGDRSELETLLQHLKIPFEEGSLLIPATQDKRFVYSTRFTYNESLADIRIALQDVVDKIATNSEVKGDFVSS